MLEAIVQLWVLAVLAAGVAWWRARDERSRAKWARLLTRLTGFAVVLGVWEWLGTLPFGGWPARISLVAAAVWGVVWYLRVRLLPAWEIWWRQFLAPRDMAFGEDPRDVSRIRWPRLTVDYEAAIAPYLVRAR
jgi:hypothetical protein